MIGLRHSYQNCFTFIYLTPQTVGIISTFVQVLVVKLKTGNIAPTELETRVSYSSNNSQKVVYWGVTRNWPRNYCNFVWRFRNIKLNLVLPILFHNYWLLNLLNFLNWLFFLYNWCTFYWLAHFSGEWFWCRRRHNSFSAWPKERNSSFGRRQKRSQNMLLSLIVLLDFWKIFDVVPDPLNRFVFSELLRV